MTSLPGQQQCDCQTHADAYFFPIKKSMLRAWAVLNSLIWWVRVLVRIWVRVIVRVIVTVSGVRVRIGG